MQVPSLASLSRLLLPLLSLFMQEISLKVLEELSTWKTYFHFTGDDAALLRHRKKQNKVEGLINFAHTFCSFFGYIILHMLMYAGDIYFWKRYRVNYSFIFGLKQGTELGYREVLLLSSGLAVLTFSCALSNLDMEMDPRTKSFRALTEVVPLGLLIVSLIFSVI